LILTIDADLHLFVLATHRRVFAKTHCTQQHSHDKNCHQPAAGLVAACKTSMLLLLWHTTVCLFAMLLQGHCQTCDLKLLMVLLMVPEQCSKGMWPCLHMTYFPGSHRKMESISKCHLVAEQP
jgi:hypothetical protein